MSVLDFKGYVIKEMNYYENDSFNIKGNSLELSPELSARTKHDNNEITIDLSVEIGKKDDSQTPFVVSCSIQGKFVYHPDEDEGKFGINTFMRNNCVAILYPYVRAIVGNLTALSNKYPGYYMPTINVSSALAENDENEV